VLRAEIVACRDDLGVYAVQLERALLRNRERAVGGADREGKRLVGGRVVAHHVEAGPGVGVHVVVGLHGRAGRADAGGAHRRPRVDLVDGSDGLHEVAELLHRAGLRRRLAGLIERRPVVVGGVDHVRGQPAPVRAAERHVRALDLDAVRDRREPLGTLVCGAHPSVQAGIAHAAPVVEPAGAGLGPEPGRVRGGGGAAGPAAGAVVAPVRWRRRGAGAAVGVARPARVAVERVQVVPVIRGLGEAAGCPVAVAALVVVEDGHRDPVGAGLGVQMGHVANPGPAGQVVGVLVLDLIEDDRAGAIGELVSGDDRVDRRLPLVGVGQVGRVISAVGSRELGQPVRKPAGVGLAVDVRAGTGDDVDACLVGHVEQLVHVADAGEVVDARRGGMVAPVEVDRHGVVAVRLHLLQDVPPQRRAGQPEGVELARPDERAPAIDHQRVLIEGDRMRHPAGDGRGARRLDGPERRRGPRARGHGGRGRPGRCREREAQREARGGGRGGGEPAAGALAGADGSIARHRALLSGFLSRGRSPAAGREAARFQQPSNTALQHSTGRRSSLSADNARLSTSERTARTAVSETVYRHVIAPTLMVNVLAGSGVMMFGPPARTAVTGSRLEYRPPGRSRAVASASGRRCEPAPGSPDCRRRGRTGRGRACSRWWSRCRSWACGSTGDHSRGPPASPGTYS
jgi:hypothetical protein